MSINRRKQIIDAATKSFSQFGYKATTMDQVSKLADVGKGTIYTFFRNKEELFEEIILSLIDEMKTTADEAIDPTRTFYENAHHSLYKILEFRLEHQLTIKLFQEKGEFGTQIVHNMMDKLEKEIIHYIKEKVERAIQKGEIKECDPELTAFIMLKLYVTLIFDWEKHHQPLQKEKIAELFELYIFKGLSK